WKADRDTSVNWSSPAAAAGPGGRQVIVTGTRQVKAYDASTGAEQWHVGGLEWECIPSPVVEGDRVYVASGPKGLALAIRLDGRRGDLTETNVLWQSRRGTPYVPSPLCYGGRYYQVSDDGIDSCLDTATGAELWRERLGGRFHASLVA